MTLLLAKGAVPTFNYVFKNKLGATLMFTLLSSKFGGWICVFFIKVLLFHLAFRRQTPKTGSGDGRSEDWNNDGFEDLTAAAEPRKFHVTAEDYNHVLSALEASDGESPFSCQGPP